MVGDLNFSSMVALADGAAEHNAQWGVTGFLCYADQRFLQVLEGEAAAVNSIYHSRILPCGKHRAQLLLQFVPVGARLFGDWSMGFANVGPLEQPTVLRYFPRGKMEAELIAPEGALEFMREVSARRAACR